MRSKKSKIIVILTVLFLGVPFVIGLWLSAKIERYDELVSMVECYPFPCTSDFNQNGTLDLLEVAQKNPNDSFDLWLTVTDDGREMFSTPYDSADNTFRTHAAIRKESEKPRLLIFDKASRQHVIAAFEWDGEKMSEVQTSSLDEELLTAMAAHDDTGTHHQWIVYRLTSAFLLPIYLLIAGGLIFLFGRSSLGRKLSH